MCKKNHRLVASETQDKMIKRTNESLGWCKDIDTSRYLFLKTASENVLTRLEKAQIKTKSNFLKLRTEPTFSEGKQQVMEVAIWLFHMSLVSKYQSGRSC